VQRDESVRRGGRSAVCLVRGGGGTRKERLRGGGETEEARTIKGKLFKGGGRSDFLLLHPGYEKRSRRKGEEPTTGPSLGGGRQGYVFAWITYKGDAQL